MHSPKPCNGEGAGGIWLTWAVGGYKCLLFVVRQAWFLCLAPCCEPIPIGCGVTPDLNQFPLASPSKAPPGLERPRLACRKEP